ncbi:MAG: MBOAT family O-acyltransferase [Bacteroidota bacterium]
MLFNSAEFLLFFPLVVAAYFLLPARGRVYWLLAASYYFYAAWKLEYVLLIMGSTLVDFWVAQRMAATDHQPTRRRWLYLSLGFNLGLLAIFKYANFLGENLQLVFDNFNIMAELPHWDFLLPVGISFYTFQTLAYTLDVYHGRLQPERSLAHFALYVSFFPQLVAGPIERAGRLLPQFRQKMSFDAQRIIGGVQQIIWGLCKKLVIADRLGVYVGQVYGNYEAADGPALWLATIFFALQIYCDFSGYSDIAIGAARVMGFELMDNFHLPYLARSPREFWARWHISLSTWFRDYVYIPLGGNRVKRGRWLLNILLVFALSGLWHGANWNFVIWGVGHATLLIASLLLAKTWQRVLGQGRGVKLLNWFLTLLFVLLLWVFFRAENLSQSLHILTELLSTPFNWTAAAWQNLFNFREAGRLYLDLFLVLAFILADPWLDGQVKRLRSGESFRYGPLIVPTLLAIILIFGYFGEVAFIYFQF